MTLLTRRRFLAISAACAAVPAAAGNVAQWRGIALGAPASLRLEGSTDAQAAPIFAAVEAELNRLENIFSLYRTHSQISQLNRIGHLVTPAPELLEVLSLCSTLHDASGGVFDPTIQPMWLALASGAAGSQVERARQTIGWDKIHVSAGEIRLPHPGRSAITLNGIAQGAITDRISALMRSFDLRDVLVDMGEVAALGQRSNGEPWRVGLAKSDGAVAKRITLQDRAVATSAPEGTMLQGDQGHILNPKGLGAPYQAVSISASQAALADGLSTALCLTPRAKANALISRFPGARIEMSI